MCGLVDRAGPAACDLDAQAELGTAQNREVGNDTVIVGNNDALALEWGVLLVLRSGELGTCQCIRFLIGKHSASCQEAQAFWCFE